MGDKQCAVCTDSLAKYKCPTCKIGYCSLKCWKQHKLEPCAPPETASQQPPSANPSSSVPPADGIPDDDEEKHRLSPEDLHKLDGAARVKEMLANPQLRALIESVRADPDPVQAIRVLRQRPDFEELAQAMLEATDSQK
ncbi:hypothetical protein LPJ63_001398 [Coemansia sp. RSA 2711]|nr:hypothetical protein LPJ63_001398 [Coemansia sp. RSA 2711]